MRGFCRHKRRAYSLIELLVALAIISVLFALAIAALSRIRLAAERRACQDHIRQIAVALQQHHAIHGALPPGIDFEKDEKPHPTQYQTWLTKLLPLIDQDPLWQSGCEAYRHDPIFLHDPPHTNLSQPVVLFACPADSRAAKTGSIQGKSFAFTSYLGSLGVNERRRDGVLFSDSQVSLNQVADGTSQTLMIGERPPSTDLALGWWYAGMGQRRNGDAEVVLGSRPRCYGRHTAVCEEGPYHFQVGKFENQCDAFHFWSPHKGGAHFAFCDGSVRFLHYSSDSVLPALSTRAGGESISDID